MNKFIFLFVAFLISCSSAPHSPTPSVREQRQPSGVSEDTGLNTDKLETSYKSIMLANDPSAEMLAYLSRLKRIYYRAESRLLAFDKVLDNIKGPLDLTEMPSYKDIVVMWPLKQRMLEKISFVYARLTETTNSSDSSAQEKEIATKVLADFAKELSSKNEVDRVIYRDLFEHLETESASTETEEKPQDKNSDIKMKELAAAVTRTRKIMQHRGALEEKKSDDIKIELDDLREKWELKPAASEREPQSSQIVPSTGPNGTMAGFNFPLGVWALTYDDGPHPQYTLKNLANLKANGMKATFFWLAQNVKSYPKIVKTVQAAGMEVENHSWSHPALNSPKDLARLKTNLNHEINDSTAMDTEIYGSKPKFFRCPYGAGINNPVVRKMIADQGLISVVWNVDSLDWQDKNPASILARVQKQMAAQKRGIILFHDVHPQSVEASRMLMQTAKSKYSWVTIPEIVNELNQGASK